MTDPNADLIGLAIPYIGDACTYVVEKSCEWSSEYVTGRLEYDNGTVMQNVTKTAAVVRRRKELDGVTSDSSGVLPGT